MIYGIGADLVDPSRIAHSLQKYGERFARRILTINEWPEYSSSSKSVLFLASRFAAKEALSKAMGTGMRYPVKFDYITVVHDALGKPSFKFHPELNKLIREEGIVKHYLSISDEINMTCAFVILEK